MKSKILKYIDFETVNIMLQGFNKLTGFVTAIIDFEGNVLSQSGWRRICTEFHRKNRETAKNCRISDVELANQIRTGQKFNFYQCMNGLIDVAVPIVINGEHIANLFTGQFFFEQMDISFFKKQAKEYGFDEKSYFEALAEVPIFSKEKAEEVMDLLLNITQIIIKMTHEKLYQIEINEELKRSIMERKMAEEQLVHSRDLMRYIIEHNRSAVAVHDRDLKYLYVSQRYLNDYKVKDKDIIGKHHYDIFPDLPQKWRDVHQKALQGEISSAAKDAYTKEDGTTDWTRWECRPWYEADGSIGGIIVYTEVITDRIQVENKLIESEVHYHTLIKTTQDGFWVVDINGKITDVNETYCQMTGYTKTELLGMKIADLEALETPEDTVAHIKLITENKSDIFETRHKKKDGSLLDMEVSATFVNSDAGVFAFCRDITERKKAENELFYLSYHDHLTGLYNRRFFEEELQRIDTQENLPISIIMIDINGLKLVNDSFGHDSGDELLKKAAITIKKACREEDIITRIGGDEFLVLLPKTNAYESVQIANHIKELASKEKVANIILSLSYGYDTKINDKQSIIEIMANAENHMYRHKLYERSSMRSKTIDLIMSTLFEKSNRELLHSQRVSALCKAIASSMNLDKDVVNQLGIAGLIHDIGKIGIDEKILNKIGMLTNDERKNIEKHPEIGWRVLSSTDEFSELGQFVLNHHEKWDGSGYPNGLKGIQIPIEARILVVADAYDAMTSERTYKKGMSKEEAVEELKKCSGTHFDPSIVDVFVNQVLIDNNNFEIE